MQRIPDSRFEIAKVSSQTPYSKPTVVLFHPLSVSSNIYLCQSEPNHSLAFVLADAGFDVWLASNRV